MGRIKRSICLILVAALLLALCPPMSTVMALNQEKTIITVEKAYCQPGQTVDFDVTIKNNVGIHGALLRMEFDPYLTVEEAVAGPAFKALSFTPPNALVSGNAFVWSTDAILEPEMIKDGVILTLKVRLAEDAPKGQLIDFNLKADPDNIVDSDMNNVPFIIEPGGVTAVSYKPGDVNGDRVVNIKDTILISRFFAGGYNVSINENAANVNGDTKLNIKDVIWLSRYLAGGYGIELYPSAPACTHSMQEVPFKAPTCTETGTAQYWKCSKCGKCFADAAGNHEVQPEKMVLPAAGHKPEVIPAVPAKPGKPGLTEGSRCSVCGVILKPQEPVEATEFIVYDVYGSEKYLQEKGGIVNPNPSVYDPRYSTRLQNLKAEGYTFDGWYDTASKTPDAKRITEIPAGTHGQIELFAHWTPTEYTIQFKTPVGEIPLKHYYINTGATLLDPEWYGYNFVCWTDEKGNVVSGTIPKGTTGDFQLTANWTSRRNQTISEIDPNPIIEEYPDEGLISFTYKIGRIENVPLYLIKDFGSVLGLTTTETFTTSKSVEQSKAENVVQTVAKATTRTGTMALSKDWNETTSIDEEHSNEVSKEVIDKTIDEHREDGTWNIGNAFGNSNTTKLDCGVSAKIGSSTTGGGQVGVGPAKVSASHTVSAELGGHIDYSDQNTSTWNTNLGYKGSQSDVNSSEHTDSTISKIQNKYSVGSSLSEGKNITSTTTSGESVNNSREYATTFNYATKQMETVTKTYSNEGAVQGHYRLVAAGTVHVFAKVIYNVADRTYSLQTINIMDDEIKEFVDYSATTSSYNDQENGVLPLEVPYFVHEYVSEKILRSDGLEVSPDTGIVTKYTDKHPQADTPKTVLISEYFSNSKETGNAADRSFIRVTGIAPGLFMNQNVDVVILPDTVTEIPASAFEGCTKLTKVVAKNVTKIGDNAFKGCTALKELVISDKVTSLGTNALEGVSNVTVNASNPEVAMAAMNSSAKELTLNLKNMSGSFVNTTIHIPESMNYFAFNGGEKTYNGVRIISDAKKTMINGATFTGCTDTPLVMNSPEVIINRTTVNAGDSIALRMNAPDTAVSLYGNNRMNSNGLTAVISKNVSFKKQNESISSRLITDGDFVICGAITSGQEFVDVRNGQIIYSKGGQFNVYFDANGGSVSETSRVVVAAEPLGELPVPTRENYRFIGWYTRPDGGQRVTKDSFFADPVNVKLYAHWELLQYTIYFNANGGSVHPASKTAIVSEPIGRLPVPTRDYYTFDGWYTSSNGGTHVTSSTSFFDTSTRTLYAHWTENPVSDWVPAESMPVDGQIIDEKWTYRETTRFESQRESEPGATQVSSRWVENGSGSRNYASFPDGFDHNHWIWQQFGSAPYSASESNTNKRVVSNNWAGYVYWHWMYDCGGANGHAERAINAWYGRGHDNGFMYKFFGAFTSNRGDYRGDKGYCNSQMIYNYIIPERTAYGDCQGATRWFRFDYYTSYYTDYYKMFTYQRVLDKESASEVRASSTISNVQKWVKYRAKDSGARLMEEPMAVVPQSRPPMLMPVPQLPALPEPPVIKVEPELHPEPWEPSPELQEELDRLEQENLHEEPIPDETVPDETVPDETVPDETVPDETAPDETVPDETAPDETAPDETVSDETVPDENVSQDISSQSDKV